MCRRKVMVCTAHTDSDVALNFAWQYFYHKDSSFSLFNAHHNCEKKDSSLLVHARQESNHPSDTSLAAGSQKLKSISVDHEGMHLWVNKPQTPARSLEDLLEQTLYADLLIIPEKMLENNLVSEKNQPWTQVTSLAHCPVIIVPETFRKLQNLILVYDDRPSSFEFVKKMLVTFPDLCQHLATTLLYVQSEDPIPVNRQKEKSMISYLRFHCSDLGMHKVQDRSGLHAAGLFNADALLVVPPYLQQLPDFLQHELQEASTCRLLSSCKTDINHFFG